MERKGEIEIGADLYYWDTNGFAKINADGSLERIGANKVDKYFSHDVDLKVGPTLNVSRDGKSVKWVYPAIDGQPRGLVYDTETKQWSQYTAR